MAAVPVLSASAQEIDNTATLPDAKPGECYAKVVVPPKMATRSEQLVIQAASERIETTPAAFETVSEQVLVQEASQRLEVVEADFGEEQKQIEVRAAELQWMATQDGRRRRPASSADIAAIKESGIDIDKASPDACFREYYKPATYGKQTRRVMVRPAHEKLMVEEAEFETVEERVVVKEASSRVIDVPAVFRNETESVLVEPARSEWKAGRGPIERIDNSTGEIMCLVEIPARYETITKTVLDTPASTRTVDIPAEYKTIKVRRLVKPASERREQVEAEYKDVDVSVKESEAQFFWLAKGEDAGEADYTGQEVCLVEHPAEFQNVKVSVIKEPASFKSTSVPARYQTIEMQKLVTPASEKRIVIPERSRTITSQVQVEPSRLEWRKVLCETNMTADVIRRLQRALDKAGHDPGKIDGVLGRGTLQAIENYQIAENIDRGGITYETLEKLGVEP
ncbi:MAG: hypothetical protein CSB44_11045 [Gammaproteobacteria bacterium]|nr:MAG: hypothetical protein CSB44_11045 [Gammaproteobacteria bacterium]